MRIQTIEVTLASRQTPESRFSHFDGSEQELLNLIFDNFFDGKMGMREGIWHVTVPPQGFKSGVVQLNKGDTLKGVFEARQDDEIPRKVVTTIGREKLPARHVEIILYSKDVLEENPMYKASADWEVISVNASPIDGPTPIAPTALIANHFGMSGGSDTDYTSEQFEKALKESVMFWHDKAMCG